MLTPNIENAISSLYDAFANVPKPHVIHGCPCCIERKEADAEQDRDVEFMVSDTAGNGIVLVHFWPAVEPHILCEL